MLRLLKWGAIAAAVAVAALWLNFTLPSHDIVRIVGTDTKRLDSSGWFDSETPGVKTQNTRDVRFINTVHPNGSVRVFRNEDTGWSFPFYLKFDSGTLQGKAQALTSGADNPQWVLVTSQGWRIPYLGMFPNALRLRLATGPDEVVIPWFNIVVLSVLALAVGWIVRRIRRFKRERVDPVLEDIGQRIDGAVGTWSDTPKP